MQILHECNILGNYLNLVLGYKFPIKRENIWTIYIKKCVFLNNVVSIKY